jgi:hypothetical protein
MRRKLLVGLGLAALAGGPGAAVAHADFVCPVLGISEQGASHNQAPAFQQIGGGDYSIIGPDVTVPDHATNLDGAGDPGSAAHAAPGDSGYSAIWNAP